MDKNRVWGHKELAVLYFPDSTPKSASSQLALWIWRDEELLADLQKAGYRKGQRIYTPRRVAVLVDHLGEPETWRIR
ncbi:MAG: DUF4248 domain-containing protein [Parabacteroides sp.]|nr:DUF4248 domain-containing protein [Parabacteroides sp.]